MNAETASQTGAGVRENKRHYVHDARMVVWKVRSGVSPCLNKR